VGTSRVENIYKYTVYYNKAMVTAFNNQLSHVNHPRIDIKPMSNIQTNIIRGEYRRQKPIAKRLSNKIGARHIWKQNETRFTVYCAYIL